MAAKSSMDELIIDLNRSGSTEGGVVYTRDSGTLDENEGSLRYRSSGATDSSGLDSPEAEGFVDVSVNG